MEASQHRREFKFVLSPGLEPVVRARIADFMQADKNSADGYPVISEYFDTSDRSSYWAKQFAVPNRRRLRGRVYGRNDGSIAPSAFIEVKHKLEGETVKRRVPVALADLEEFAAGRVPETVKCHKPSDIRVLAEISALLHAGANRPVVQIRYDRYAYDTGPEGSIRITFDLDPRCRFRLIPITPDDPDFELPLLEKDAAIMEVKTIGAVPYWFRSLVAEFGLHPRSFSKYTAALEMYEFRCLSPIQKTTNESKRVA